MPVEICGMVSHNTGTPLAFAPQDEFDLEAIVASAQAQEAAGYDRVLIANNALMPDPHTIATYVAAHTTRLKFLIAHRPGFIAPTAAARLLATVDRLSKGRVGVHVIAGPSDKELEADGDFLTKDERYARAREYVGILRRIWGSAGADRPCRAQFYRFNQAFAPIKPFQTPAPPVFWAGTSDASVEACGEVGDVFAMSGDSLANIRAARDRAAAAAARHGRTAGLHDDRDRHPRAERSRGLGQGRQGARGIHRHARPAGSPPPRARQTSLRPAMPVTVLATAAAGARHDRCLWMGVTEAAAGKFGNQTTLVGTPEQVTEALMDYYRMGVTRFLIRGFRPAAGYCRIWPRPVPHAARCGGDGRPEIG